MKKSGKGGRSGIDRNAKAREKALATGMAGLMGNQELVGRFGEESFRQMRSKLEIQRQRDAMQMARELLGFADDEAVPAGRAGEVLDMADAIIERMDARVEAAAKRAETEVGE